MKKHRVNTTISTKHWEMLKKYMEEHGTQQKVLEMALENLKRKPKADAKLSPEEQLWMRIVKELKRTCFLHKDILMELMKTADYGRIAELITRLKILEYQLVFYYQKPLKECSLKEVMDGIVITTGIGNWLDTINYTENGSYYTLKVMHSLWGRNPEQDVGEQPFC